MAANRASSLFLAAASLVSASSDLPGLTAAEKAENRKSVIVWLGQFDWVQWSGIARRIRSGHTIQQCLNALADELSSETQIYQAQYAASSGLLAVMPTLAVFLGGESKDLWALFQVAPICGFLDCLLSMGGKLVPDTLNDLEKQVGGLGFGDSLRNFITNVRPDLADSERYQNIDASFRTRRNLLRRKPRDCNHCCSQSFGADDGCGECPCDWEQEVERVRERVRRDPQLTNTRFPSTLWLRFNACIMVVFLGTMMLTIALGEAGAVVSGWCTCSFWMFFWWFMVSLNTVFTSYCNSPYQRTWRIKATALHAGITNLAVIAGSEAAGGLGLLDSTSVPMAMQKEIERAIWKADKNEVTMTEEELGEKPLPRAPRRRAKELKPLLAYKGSPFCILVTVRGVSKVKTIFRQISRVTTGAVFLIATGWLSSVTLLPTNMAILLTTTVGASSLFARFGAETIVRTIGNLDACVHFPVATNKNASELINEIATIPNVLLEVEDVQMLNGQLYERSWKSRTGWTVFGLL